MRSRYVVPAAEPDANWPEHTRLCRACRLRLAKACARRRVAAPLPWRLQPGARSMAALRVSLHRYEERYRKIVEQSPDAIWVIEGECLTLINQAGLDLIGAANPGSVLATNIRRLLPDYADPDIAQALAHLSASEPPVRLQTRLRRNDGTLRIVELSAAEAPDHDGRAIQMVLRDVTERDRTLRLLEASRAQLRRLTGNLIHAREDERQHVARELHDELGQRLLALKLDVAHLAQTISEPAPRACLVAVDRHMAELVDAVRRLASDLRPAALDDLGLQAAVDTLAREFAERTGLRVSLHCSPRDLCPGKQVAIAAYRFVQEALTNVATHAQARHVRIDLRGADGLLNACVADDGTGMAPGAAAKTGSYGLAGMRERARYLGGKLVIKPAEGGGTSLTLSVPLQVDQPELEP